MTLIQKKNSKRSNCSNSSRNSNKKCWKNRNNSKNKKRRSSSSSSSSQVTKMLCKWLKMTPFCLRRRRKKLVKKMSRSKKSCATVKYWWIICRQRVLFYNSFGMMQVWTSLTFTIYCVYWLLCCMGAILKFKEQFTQYSFPHQRAKNFSNSLLPSLMKKFS
jgi:hypothetical protein